MNRFSKELVESLTEACEHAKGNPGRVMMSIRETAEGLAAAGVMSKQTMREFDKLCSTPVEALTSEGTVTVREVLRLLLEADSYPRVGNEDWATAARMETAALEKAATALASPDDPPEFARWLEGLRNPSLSADEREQIYWAIHDYFREEARR